MISETDFRHRCNALIEPTLPGFMRTNVQMHPVWRTWTATYSKPGRGDVIAIYDAELDTVFGVGAHDTEASGPSANANAPEGGAFLLHMIHTSLAAEKFPGYAYEGVRRVNENTWWATTWVHPQTGARGIVIEMNVDPEGKTGRMAAHDPTGKKAFN